MSQDTEGIKARARRTLEEIFPNGDIAGLAEVVHPDCVNHEAPPGAPQGLDGMTQTVLWLQGAFSDRRYQIHQVIAEGDTVAVHCTFSGRHTGSSWACPRRTGPSPPARSTSFVSRMAKVSSTGRSGTTSP